MLGRAGLLGVRDEIAPEHLPVAKMQSLQRFEPSSPAIDLPPLPAASPTTTRREVAAPSPTPAPPPPPDDALGERADQLEREMWQLERARIVQALEVCAGNQTRAAEQLGISRRTLLKRLDQYDIPRPRKRRTPR